MEEENEVQENEEIEEENVEEVAPEEIPSSDPDPYINDYGSTYQNVLLENQVFYLESINNTLLFVLAFLIALFAVALLNLFVNAKGDN